MIYVKDMFMKNLNLIVLFLMIFVMASCKEEKTLTDKTSKRYIVKKMGVDISIDSNWDKAAWSNIQAEKLGYFMGEKPEHSPDTQFKVAYDDKYVYVIFKVEDQYIRAVGKGYQSSVCWDSCVEFFFTPSEDISKGYFNLETNCGGTMLMYHQIVGGQDIRPLANEELDQIQIAHSLPEIIQEEITEPTTWTLEYKLPISILQKYSDLIKPELGVKWKANFYKCGDKTSHPHWLTWSFVDKPKPDFHRPDFFGTLEFK